VVKVVVLGSGSRGNATLVVSGRTRVLIDAGFSRAEIARRLHAVGERLEDVDALLLTHEHGDHARGVRVIASKGRIPVACHAETLRAAHLDDGAIPEWMEVEAGRAFTIGDLAIEPFMVPHDAALTLGFRIRAEGLSIAYCTDLGHVTHVVRDRLAGANVLIVESNHDLDMLRDGDYPWSLKQRIAGRHGHLSNDATAGLLESVVDGEAMVVALAHLSESNNVPDLAAHEAREALRRRGCERVPVVVTHQDRAEVVAVA
jgi:phosphoribosyl 1,2-cyclic phosphodiesterase